VLDDRRGGTPPEDTLTLLVCGAGAYALLAHETGLHQLSRGLAKGRQKPPDRDVVRVEVLPLPLGDASLGNDEVRVEVRPLSDVRGRLLARPRFEVQLLHLPTMTAVHAWTDGPRAEAVERLRPLLLARVEAARRGGAASDPRAFVRRYVLGPAPLVRDLRTRRSTGRLDRVWQGHIDMFLGSGEAPG
jgi:peptide chain release factor 2